MCYSLPPGHSLFYSDAQHFAREIKVYRCQRPADKEVSKGYLRAIIFGAKNNKCSLFFSLYISLTMGLSILGFFSKESIRDSTVYHALGSFPKALPTAQQIRSSQRGKSTPRKRTSTMCIYALYQYRYCPLHHHLGHPHSTKGGRPFRMRPCELNIMATDDIKEVGNSRYGTKDVALPCEGEQIRIHYVDQPCHMCDIEKAWGAGWPLNRDYPLPAAEVLRWHIPDVQTKGSFREVSYTCPKRDVDEEEPVSPKSLFRNDDASNASDDSNSSMLALRPQPLQIRKRR